MDSIKEKRYIKIPNFFSKEELDFLQVYVKRRLPEGNVTDPQSPVAFSFFNDPIFDILHQTKTKLAEEISSLRLIPTYTYWRAYVYGSILETHTDKPTCEISVTANIDSCGTLCPYKKFEKYKMHPKFWDHPDAKEEDERLQKK